MFINTFCRYSKTYSVFGTCANAVRNIATARSKSSTTVDPREIKHFNKLVDDWWNPLGPLKALHSMNEIRVPFIRDGLLATNSVSNEQMENTKLLEEFNILEVGCGCGVLTENLASRLRANVVGLDASSEVIKAAKHHVRTHSPELAHRIQYKAETIENFVQNNMERFDAVIMSEVVEHVENVPKFLAAGVDALKPGGSIFITTPNRTIRMFFLGIVLAEYILEFIPKGTHQWNKFVKPLETQRILEGLNCSTLILNGCTYEFWRNTWKWVSNTNFCYAIQAVKRSDPIVDGQKK